MHSLFRDMRVERATSSPSLRRGRYFVLGQRLMP